MKSIRLGICTIALALAGVANAAEKYPRVAAHTIGNPHNYESAALQSTLAKFDIVMMNYWPGWETGKGTTMNAVAQNIKAKNPNAKVFLYVIPGGLSRSPAAWAELVQKLDENKWWLYPSGSSGSAVADSWPGYYTANTTLFAPKDANGDRWIDYFAKWITKKYYQPNPAIDGFYTDTVYWKPRDTGDWNRDGRSDDPSDATVAGWMREGYAAYFSTLRAQLPANKMQIANISDWGHSEASLTFLTGTVDGGLIEGLIGYSYSPETWGGWTEMMRWYRKALNATSGKKMGVFHQVGSVTDYKSMRYGLASSLMDNGWYSFNAGPDASAYGDAPWFDEYDADLGAPLSGPSTSAWQQGVYRREYERGIVLVNPKGNGQKTLTLDTSYRKLTGTQAPSVNNGEVVTTITLPDRDGIILKRLNIPKKPAAPTGVSVQ